MSAYVVDLDHIAYLVQAGTSRSVGLDDSMSDASKLQLGQMLWDENVKSVQARYPGDQELPGPCAHDYVYPERNYPWFRTFDPIQVLKACDCYEYQSCEHEGWSASAAKRYIEDLRARAWTSLPGYEEARWGAPLTAEAIERRRKAGEAVPA